MAAAEEWRQSGAKRDPAGNATTRLPPGEEVRVPVIWLAEIFTPTTIDGLINGVRELAGRPSGAWQTSADDIIEWIRSSRADGLFSYKNANYILPKGRGIDPKITDQLPAGISYIHLRLYTLTPSITVLTATFGLEDEKARGLEDILNHNYSTQIEKNPDGFSLLSVGLQKDRHADEWRAAIRDDAARWLARRLPGFFHKLAPGQLPTIELLLTGIYRPWEPVVKLSDVPGWTGIIDISGGFGYWQCDGIDCLRLSERHARARKPDQ